MSKTFREFALSALLVLTFVLLLVQTNRLSTSIDNVEGWKRRAHSWFETSEDWECKADEWRKKSEEAERRLDQCLGVNGDR